MRKEEEAERKKQELAELTEQRAGRALQGVVDLIKAKVSSNWRPPPNAPKGLEALIEVTVEQDGTVLDARVVKSSGDARFDLSVEIAVRKSSPIPFPEQSEYYQHIRIFNFRFNPDG